MAGVRHLMIALLAVIGLISMPLAASDAEACPAETSHAMAMHHQMQHGGTGQPIAGDHNLAACPTCVAVLPAPAGPGANQLLPFAPLAETFRPLSGIDPALDPPPPRG